MSMGSRNITIFTEFILLGFSGHPRLEIFLFVVLSMVYFMTLFGNISILALTCLDSHLHTPMYFFLSNLAFLNICYTSAVVPKMLINFLAPKKTISYHLCVVQVYITLFLAAAECLLLMVMAFDRYVAICNPLHYSTVMNKNVCLVLAVMAWFSSFMLSVVPSFTMKHSLCSFVIDHLFCEAPVLLLLACPNDDISVNEVMMVAGSTFTLLLPSVLILLSYVRIMVAVLRMPSMDRKRKAFSTCSAHITVVTVYYGSGLFMYMRPKSSYSAEKDKLISLFYSVINPMLNPIIYSLRNKDVKEAFMRVLGRTKES
ncbi:olfactory receptor 2G3-like [Hemicordylus capensis]|uniref:olfactory receptor 2G3-like n=1 Tax=Hemicordylus capensis TaxID=884348 RepID=UPI002302B1CD|nr:olfactory receptor 2G3-like [Hemicordylus capensis]